MIPGDGSITYIITNVVALSFLYIPSQDLCQPFLDNRSSNIECILDVPGHQPSMTIVGEFRISCGNMVRCMRMRCAKVKSLSIRRRRGVVALCCGMSCG